MNLSLIFSSTSTKKILFIASSILYLLLLLVFILLYAEGFVIGRAVLFSLISVVGLLLVIKPYTNYKNLIRVVPVPFSLIFASFLLLNFFPNLNTWFKLSFVSFSVVTYYFMVLSLNVFLVVSQKGSSIPLLRPAKTAFLLIQVVSAFLFITAVNKLLLPEPITEATFVFQTLIIFITTYLYSENYWWSQNLENEALRFVGNESLVVAFLSSCISVAVSFYPTEAFFRSLAITTCFYISVNFFQSIITHRFNSRQFVEYFFIAALVLLFILFA